jgi:hypothetical protein
MGLFHMKYFYQRERERLNAALTIYNIITKYQELAGLSIKFGIAGLAIRTSQPVW